MMDREALKGSQTGGGSASLRTSCCRLDHSGMNAYDTKYCKTKVFAEVSQSPAQQVLASVACNAGRTSFKREHDGIPLEVRRSAFTVI